MKATREFRPHSVECHNGQHGTLIRVCKNCGSSWFLKLHGDTHDYAWMPIAELTADGKPIEADVDITFCYAGDSPREPKQAQTQPQSPTEKPKGLCYCETCRVKRQHFDGDDRCFCVKCRGNRPHKAL